MEGLDRIRKKVLMATYQSLKLANEQLVEGFPGLVTVAYIFEGLGSILAGDIAHNLLTTAIRDVSSAIFISIRPHVQKLGMYSCSH